MPLFTSKREKRLWQYALMVLLAIISTLVYGTSMNRLVDHPDKLAFIGMTGMIMIAITVLVHGLRIQPGKVELATWLGLAAVYLLLFLRLGHPERTHLVEYSVLAVFIHMAIMERAKENQIRYPAFLAFIVTLTIGSLDEGVQIFLPSRVFDPIDILFNGLAAFMTIVASMMLMWLRQKMGNTKTH